MSIIKNDTIDISIAILDIV